jgi:signal peptidase I
MRSARRTTGRRMRPVGFAAGTVSMLLITTVASLSMWIALPWAFLGWSPTLVTSGSMSPVVSPGDVVLIRPAGTEELVPDSVVLFRRPDGEAVLHRISALLPDGTLQTRGDANLAPDSDPVDVSDVQGVAVLAVPWVGHPSLWLVEGHVALVAGMGVLALVLLALAPRAFDPTFDPWGGTRRVSPASVLLSRSRSDRPDGRTARAGELLPGDLHDTVLARLASQSAIAQTRTARLLEGTS